MNQKSLRRLLLILALGTGLSAFGLWQTRQSTADARPGTPVPRRPAALAAPGLIEPVSRVIALRSSVQGRLIRVTKRSGEAVKTGELLAELENGRERAQVALRRAELSQARAVHARLKAGARVEVRQRAAAELRQTEAKLSLAKVALARTKRLVQGEIRSKHALDEAAAEARAAKAACDAARARQRELAQGERPERLQEAKAQVASALAALELAQADLARTRILSPIDGVCVYRYKEPGEVVGRVSETAPFMSVAGGGQRVRVEVDASDLGRVRVGQRAHVSASAFPGREFSGSVIKREIWVGRKNLRSDRPREKVDTKVLEVLVALDPAQDSLPLGLEVTCRFEE